MDWYTPTLASYRLRTVRVGIHMTVATLIVLVLYPLLPDSGEVNRLPYYAFLVVAGAGLVVVALLPWQRLLRSQFGLWMFYAWSCLDIVLISATIAVTGGGDSQLFVLYTLTSTFFAASYPPGGHLALLGFTAGCYLGTLWILGSDTGLAVLLLRVSMLGLIIYMMRFLSIELMVQNESLVASGTVLRDQAAELDRMRLAAEHLATHDSLTGLLNRGAWFHAAMTRGPSAVAIIDVDHFKRINDCYGHPGGDEVLRVIAWRLVEALEPAGVVGRLGGEEFGVVFDAEPDDAARLCAMFVDKIAVTPIASPRGPVDVTVSAGLAAWVASAQSREASLALTYDRADQALYAAKHAGRNRLVVHPPVAMGLSRVT